ncbi:hypothetical protein MtrunA17_Chr5g0397681 [Medicago truncatula]|uniref:Uncharacterized protein n=1 Tax=Medicago truncatula TaxID=3880 RepID=A0A396HM01_MEDTR|nr:hypothetical protein MtrunA17_Chr5g0397681 [Medicago truncatula]
MKSADQLMKDETQYLCEAMGHGNDSLEDFVEAHTTCINDLMYFDTRNTYIYQVLLETRRS